MVFGHLFLLNLNVAGMTWMTLRSNPDQSGGSDLCGGDPCRYHRSDDVHGVRPANAVPTHRTGEPDQDHKELCPTDLSDTTEVEAHPSRRLIAVGQISIQHGLYKEPTVAAETR
jgi:hypothetical protein